MLRRAVCLVAVSLALGFGGVAKADLIQLTDRSSLTGPAVKWSAYGTPGQTLSTPVDQSFGPSLTVGIGSSAGLVKIRQQDNDFNGNFAPGDTLLSLPDGYKSDALFVSFSGQAIYGLGVQIEPVSGFAGAFTAGMDLYGAANQLLGVVLVNGNATQADDGSAVFLGAASTTAISYVRFFVDENDPNFPIEGDLAINDMTLGVPAPIPEPGSLFLLVAAVTILAATTVLARRKQDCQTHS